MTKFQYYGNKVEAEIGELAAPTHSVAIQVLPLDDGTAGTGPLAQCVPVHGTILYKTAKMPVFIETNCLG